MERKSSGRAVIGRHPVVEAPRADLEGAATMTVTSNDAATLADVVICNDCSRYSRERADSQTFNDEPWRRRFRGWHCTTCHTDADHFACEHCGACMERGRRALYCSSTCRVYAWKKRKAETDNDGRGGETFVIHNNHAERIAAEYRQRRIAASERGFWRLPASEQEWVETIKKHLVNESDRSGLFCGGCQRDLALDEPVWRRGWHRGVTPLLCADCVNEGNERPQTPCDACSRPTVDMRRRPHVYDLERGRIKRTFCCTRCEQAFYRKRQQAHAAKRRLREAPQVCQGCDEVIDGSRQDALYCSNACRQRAYRERKRQFTGDSALSNANFSSVLPGSNAAFMQALPSTTEERAAL